MWRLALSGTETSLPTSLRPRWAAGDAAKSGVRARAVQRLIQHAFKTPLREKETLRALRACGGRLDAARAVGGPYGGRALPAGDVDHPRTRQRQRGGGSARRAGAASGRLERTLGVSSQEAMTGSTSPEWPPAALNRPACLTTPAGPAVAITLPATNDVTSGWPAPRRKLASGPIPKYRHLPVCGQVDYVKQHERLGSPSTGCSSGPSACLADSKCDIRQPNEHKLRPTVTYWAGDLGDRRVADVNRRLRPSSDSSVQATRSPRGRDGKST